MLPDFLRPWLAAVLGPVILWLIAKFATLTGITYTPEQMQLINEGTIGLIVLGLTKIGINQKVNPVQAATKEMAAEGKAMHRAIRDAKDTHDLQARGAAHLGLQHTDLHTLTAMPMGFAVKIPLSDAQKKMVWDVFRPYKDMRIYLRDIIPGVPFIGGWSAGLGGLLTKGIGPDPAPGA